ncbi:MAG: oligosaccharide flippase family protein, partial [Rhizobium sp.]|nr:oligosaccharide flippase family protein [Rhizobium sp.]
MATFIRSSAFSTLAGIISLAFGFAGSVIVARLLGPQGSGEVAFALFIAMTASTLVGLGIPNLLLRYIPTYDRPGHPGGGLARVLLPYFLVPTVLVAAGLVAYALWLQVSDHVTEHAPSTWAMTSL